MLYPSHNIRYRISQILSLHWWAFTQQHKRWIRPVVFETVKRIVSCRTPALGFHLYGCPCCGYLRIVPHSCKSRFCPTCGKHATDRWANRVLNNLLNVHYHHIILSVPWELRPVILLNRVLCFNILFKAATKSIQDWAKSQCGMRMGIILVLHTFGSDLRFHPHIHLIVTGGGLSLDGKRWIETDPKFLMPHKGLKLRWRYNVVALFREHHKKGDFRFSSASKFLKKYPCFNSLLNKIYQYTWYAYIGASLLDPTASVRYVGRYTKRAVLAEYRITFFDGKYLRFRFKDYAQGGKTKYKALPVFAFIGRLIRHIPDKRFPMMRHAGLFANRYKAKYLALARKALGQDESSPSEEELSDPTWRERQREYTAQDPLMCPYCHIPMSLLGTLFGSHWELWLIWEYVQNQSIYPPAPG